MVYYEVISECPVHRKDVFVRVEANNQTQAINKVIGMTIDCPWGPVDTLSHKFTIKSVKGAYRLPWKPTTLVSSAPSVEPIAEEPTTPLETVYYINPDLGVNQLTKLRWWQK